MKEKIEKFAKGEFEYELPSFWFSEETIEFCVESGKTYEGTLVMKASDGSKLKGLVFSSDYHMKIKESSFYGEEVVLHYEYDATEQKAGETHPGNIKIVSNIGEIHKTFMAKVEVPYCETKSGKIRDLFQFANLAKDDWISAGKLFKSEDFRKKLLFHDKKSEMIYDGLIKSVSTSHALEEFLISVHKKVRVNITVDKSVVEYARVPENVMDKIVITKDNWGYMEIKVSTDAKFIEPERKIIWNDNFIGDTFALQFVIRKECLKKGYNYGNIYLSTPYQSFRVEVIAYGEHSSEEKVIMKQQAALVEMTQHYLNFRMARIDADTYLSDMEKLNQTFYQLRMLDECYLLKTHLAIACNQIEDVEQTLSKLKIRSELWTEEQVVYQCAYRYLEAMNKRDLTSIEEAKEFIQETYEKHPGNWRIFWFLLNVDKTLMGNSEERYLALRSILRTGTKSAMIYYEMAAIYKDHPYYIDELDRETLSVINWMIKENYLTDEVLNRFVFAAGKMKTFHPVVFRGLEKVYHLDKKAETLQVLVGMLIRAQKVGQKYFKWFEEGVKQQVRITQLYESYMYSMPEDRKQILPETVLLYFSMNCTLDERKKAFLYANLLENRESYGEIFDSYENEIKEFGKKELEKHSMNQNLALIYEELLKGTVMDEIVRVNLPAVMFKYEITCQNENIIGVIIRHNEVDDETYIPLEGGTAQGNIYTENATIFLVDKKNNRYYQSIEYGKLKYMNAERFAKYCIHDMQDNGMFLLYVYEQMEEFRKFSEYEVEVWNKLILLDELKNSIRTNCKIHLIDKYFADGALLELDELLENIDLQDVSIEQRARVLELCIVRGVKENLLHLIKTYGYEQIAPKRLYQLCCATLRKEDIADKSFLLELCFAALKGRKHSKESVQFLCDNYHGVLEDLLFIWNQAKQYEINLFRLEDCIISQGLFTEQKNRGLMDVFLSYYQKPERDKVLCRGFISYVCYKNLIFDREMPDVFVELLREYCKLEENDMAVLALLKYLSQGKELSKDELLFVEIQLNHFVKQQIIFPFFQEFHKQLTLPYQLATKHFIEYRTNPKRRVTIHYQIITGDGFCEDVEDYKQEVLSKNFYGVFVKSFLLFQNETLQYYIEEQDGEEKTITESVSITHEEELSQEENEFSLLNFMILAREVEDSETLIETMKQYMNMKYCLDEQFKLME